MLCFLIKSRVTCIKPFALQKQVKKFLSLEEINQTLSNIFQWIISILEVKQEGLVPAR